MALPRIGGVGINLGLQNQPANSLTVPSGQIYMVPSGTFWCRPGPYTDLQFKDSSGIWRLDSSATSGRIIDSDGANWRLANTTGCPIGAVITNAGTGLTNGVGTVTITTNSGSSVWTSVVGGALSTVMTVTTAGSSYTYPPELIVAAPPSGGIQALAHCALSGGTINSVTVDNIGAGYTGVPAVTVVNDSRDTTGTGGVITASIDAASSGLLTAMYPSDPGNSITGVPTFTFSPASTCAATPVMNFSVTGYTVNSTGSGYIADVDVVSSSNTVTTASVAHTANTTGSYWPIPRPCRLVAGISGVGISTAGVIVEDAGLHIQKVPSAVLITTTTNASPANLTMSVGGTNDVLNLLQPI